MTSMSVHLRPDAGNQAQPFLAQAVRFHGLDRMRLGNALQFADFVGHQSKVRMWDYPAGDHGIVPVQGLAAEDDALIGLLGGHRASVPDWMAPW